MPTWQRFSILILAVAAVWFAADWLIVSDEEAIDAALERTLERFVARDAAGALSILDDGFRQKEKEGEEITKADLTANLERILSRDPARSLDTLQRLIRVEGSSAEVRTRLRYFPAQEASMPYPFDSDWILHFQKRGKRDWRIVRIELADLAGQGRVPFPKVVRASE